MTDPVELELQLKITNQNKFADLLADPVFRKSAKRPKRVAFETTYFDTPTHRLQENGFAYRIRKSASGFTATVKNRGTDGGGLFARNEWNRPVDSEKPSVDVFSDLPMGKRLAEIVGVEDLLPIFKTIINRTAVLYSLEEGSEIELSADVGQITCQGGTEDVCEIELELKKGPVRCIFQTAEKLASRYPLLPEESSKYLRGLMLAGLAADSKDGAKKPKTFRFNKHAGYPTISTLLLEQLDAIALAQGEYIRLPISPGTIHQLRISVRTFRSLLYLLKPLLEPEAYRTMQEDFGAYIRRFSKIRDYDVLMRKMGAAEETKEFTQWVQEKRAEENQSLHLECSAGCATPMLMRAKTFLLRLGEGQGALEEERIYEAVCSRFKNKLGKFKKDFKTTDLSDAQAVHALRIRCKKLNYSKQFLNADKKDDLKTEKKLKELQKLLGRMCDIGNFMRIAGEYGTQAERKAQQDFILKQKAERERLKKEIKRLQP
jgi:triphosphatase